VKVAVLFARADSVYKTLPLADVWDIERDARKWPGGCPVVAHPPCRAWGRLRKFAHPRKGERQLAVWAVRQVRTWGGSWSTRKDRCCGVRLACLRQARATDTAAGRCPFTKTGGGTALKRPRFFISWVANLTSFPQFPWCWGKRHTSCSPEKRTLARTSAKPNASTPHCLSPNGCARWQACVVGVPIDG